MSSNPYHASKFCCYTVGPDGRKTRPRYRCALEPDVAEVERLVSQLEALCWDYARTTADVLDPNRNDRIRALEREYAELRDRLKTIVTLLDLAMLPTTDEGEHNER